MVVATGGPDPWTALASYAPKVATVDCTDVNPQLSQSGKTVFLAYLRSVHTIHVAGQYSRFVLMARLYER